MFKILLFGKLPPPYIGPAIAMEIIINSKLKNYFKIIHFDTSHHKNIKELSKFSIKNFVFPIYLYLKLIFYLCKFRPDLVYIPSQQTTIAYLRDIPFFIISKLFRKKLVCHLRGGYFLNWYEKELNSIMKWVVRETQKKIDAQVVLGHNLRCLFASLMPESKIFVVPNGADYSIPIAKKDNCKIRVTYISNYIRSKGIIDFVESAYLFTNMANIQFAAYGNWMEKTTKDEVLILSKKLNNLTINETIERDNKFKILAESHIFVLPTYYRNEGLPWVIIEAMAAGLPIISTNHAAIPEMVLDGINGFLIEKENPNQIEEKIMFLVQNPEIRIKMGKESRRIYEENFTEEKMVERLINVFNTVLKNNLVG